MLQILKFLLDITLKFASKLFTVDVGFTNLGVVFCICYILFPMMLFIVNFLKNEFMSEVNDYYDNRRLDSVDSAFRGRYIGKHEYVGRHSKYYKRRGK